MLMDSEMLLKGRYTVLSPMELPLVLYKRTCEFYSLSCRFEITGFPTIKYFAADNKEGEEVHKSTVCLLVLVVSC